MISTVLVHFPHPILLLLTGTLINRSCKSIKLDLTTMEVNKDEAERCKVIGANAMNQKEYARAAKFFRKSLSLYPLPGVEALLAKAELMESDGGVGSGNGAANGTTSATPPSNHGSQSTTSNRTSSGGTAARAGPPNDMGGRNGRNYTQAQVDIVETILRAKAQGGRTAHYNVLNISPTECTEADIKKAYRKLAVKVHPDKNSAPKADEAFKAVGLAYATLSDPQKKAIYDRYGDEDPDNRGGGSGTMRHRGPGGVHFRPGQEVSPEDIFNMFFGGGMPGGTMHRGPGGMHFYTNFGGPAGFARTQEQQQQRRRGSQQQTAPNEATPGLATLMQLLPFFLILALSFLNMNDHTSQGQGGTGSTRSPGQNRYFSLTVRPFDERNQTTKLYRTSSVPYNRRISLFGAFTDYKFLIDRSFFFPPVYS
jgi:DnaJ homolog subfamily B member 12